MFLNSAEKDANPVPPPAPKMMKFLLFSSEKQLTVM